MDENMKFEIMQLQKDTEDNKKQIGNLEDKQELKFKELDLENYEIKSQLISIAEKLITIFKRLDNIEDANKWVNRMAIGTLSGGVVTVVGALIVWLVQK